MEKDLFTHTITERTPTALYAALSRPVHEDGDSTLAILGEGRAHLTDEDDYRIRRKTDLTILPILVWVYFLQVVDKTTLGYAATFGLRTNLHLTGDQYPLIGSISQSPNLHGNHSR